MTTLQKLRNSDIGWKWRVEKDSLILKCFSIKFIIDSFNNIPKYKKGTVCNEEENYYFISKNKLSRTYLFKDKIILAELVK